MKPKKNLITIFVVTILVTMFGQTDVAKSQVVTDGLLSYWTFDADDIAGQTAKDAWGDRDGTIIGDTQVTPGIIGGALEFDGDGDYVEFDDAGLPEGDAPRTMSVWVKPEGAGVRSALEWGTSAGRQRCGILVLGGERIKFVSQNADLQSNGSVVNGEWHYVTETYDGTTMRIYIDGVLDKEQALSIDTVLNVGRIGANIGSAGENFNGAIDEVSIYDRALSAEEVAQNFAAKKGLSASVIAGVIYPEDGAIDVPRDVVLSWTPGAFANTHDVYLGTGFGDVNDAGIGNQLDVLVFEGHDANSYDIGRLELGQTYYWRVDEVNAPPDTTVVFKGNVWSFTTEPVGYPLAGASITATASSQSSVGENPNKTIDGSGLDEDGNHSQELTDMWLSVESEPYESWIQFDLDQVAKLSGMRVWNHNSSLESVVGYGIKEALIEYSPDGITWSEFGIVEFPQATGSADSQGNNISLDGIVAQSVRITAINNRSILGIKQYGLSEVQFWAMPMAARELSPADGTENVDPLPALLSWRAGRQAASHNVYVSTDVNAVTDGTELAVNVSDSSYAPELDLGATYFWRVDEVNDVEDPAVWAGGVQSFSTGNFLVVDDFESYNDILDGEEGSNLVYMTWIDGFDNPSANGSIIGYITGASMETDTVHGRSQSAPMEYNNVGAAFSEVTRTLAPQKWADNGIQTLSLWFFGDPANTPGQLYVKVNGVQVDYDGDADKLTLAGWQPWNIDLTSIGANLSSVTSLAIGIQGPGASGTLLLDDIRLYSLARELVTPVQPDAAGLVLRYEFEGNTNDSSGNARHGTPVGNPAFVAGQIGQAVNFDGTGDYIEFDDSGLPEGNAPRTMSVWVKPEGGGTRSALEWGSDASTQRCAVLVQPNNGIKFCGKWADVQSNGSVANGEWHYISETYDGTTMRIYIDGVLDKEQAVAINTVPNVGRIGINIKTTGEFFNGDIDEVRIYDRALTQEEIAWLAGWTEPFDKPF